MGREDKLLAEYRSELSEMSRPRLEEPAWEAVLAPS